MSYRRTPCGTIADRTVVKLPHAQMCDICPVRIPKITFKRKRRKKYLLKDKRKDTH